MKKLLAFILVILLLTACSSEGSDILTDRKKPAAKDPAQPITSSVFGKNVDYNAYTPAEGLTLPIPSAEILDVVQIEKRLYLLGNGGIHSLDIESGESKKLFDTAATTLTTHGGKLYTYSAETSAISEYDTSSALLSQTIVSELSGAETTDFAACEDYFVLLCGEELVSVNRSDGSLVSKTKAKKYTSKLCAYSENKALVYVGNAASTPSLYEFDAKKGSLTKLRDLTQLTNIFDMTYNLKSGTVIILGDDGLGITALYEYALDSEDNGILKKFDIKMSLHERRFVSVFENIISVVSKDEDVYRWFDYENPPEAITLAYVGEAYVQNTDLETIILNYEMAHDVIVRTVCYNDDRTRLSLKLMAGDDDIDIFSTMCMDGYLFINSHMYTDLNSFQSLGSKIESNVLADFASNRNGEYVGLPYGVTLKLNGHENVTEATAIEQYCIKNVDAVNSRFTDESGDELYKIMKFAAENPEPKKAYFDFPYSVLSADYLIINPSSEHKSLAADFLEYAFDVYSGVQSVVSMNGDMLEYMEIFGTSEEFWEHYHNPIMYLYPDMTGVENVYLYMNFRPLSIVEPLFDAYNSASYGEATNKSELKKMAKEAAAEVAMRMGE